MGQLTFSLLSKERGRQRLVLRRVRGPARPERGQVRNLWRPVAHVSKVAELGTFGIFEFFE